MNIKRTVQDIDNTIQEMDKQYDANFGEWVRSESNIDVLSSNLVKYLNEYKECTFIEVLKWITIKWQTRSKIKLLKNVFISTLFKNNSAAEIRQSKRSIRIIKKFIADLSWKSANISELIVNFLESMEREEKRLFLLWILDGFEHQMLTEIFIRIDSIVDWTLKINIIKNSQNSQSFIKESEE